MKHAIEPRLFGLVTKYAKKIKETNLQSEVTDRDILFFCTNLFVQWFENVPKIEVTGFDDKSKARAAKLLTNGPLKDDAVGRQLVAKFIDLANNWSKIRGAAYGESTEFAATFHCETLPQLLKTVSAWAASAGDGDLRNRVDPAAAAWAKATAPLCP